MRISRYQGMSRLHRKRLSIFLLLAIAMVMTIFWKNTHGRITDTERLEILLGRIREKTDPTTSISFYSEDPAASEKTELYFRAQLVMAPALLLEDQDMDTMLVVRRSGEAYQLLNYDTLVTADTLDFYAVLLRKRDH